MFESFSKPGKASFIMDGQWGSAGKGAASAYVATKSDANFSIVTTNNGPNSGHTSVHEGVKRITFHLPTYSLHQPCFTYLNAGSVIDVNTLLRELEENPQVLEAGLAIHPNAAIITQDCKDAEGRDDSAQTRIASTRKGVGEAIARKVLRSGMTAQMASQMPEHDWLRPFIQRLDLNEQMLTGQSVLVEVPQGFSLSLNSQFYPHVTSRNCTIGQAMNDADIHPHFFYQTMLVLRTFPIRVGGIYRYNPQDDTSEQVGYSGGFYPDQHEIAWSDLGVGPEITTVTKRTRRIFTFSEQQAAEAFRSCRPNVVFLSFMDYLPPSQRQGLSRLMVDKLRTLSVKHGRRGDRLEVLTGWGPTTNDVINGDEL